MTTTLAQKTPAPAESGLGAVWDPKNPRVAGAFQEVWYLKLNDPVSQRALMVRMALLVSSNGFRRIAETWAVYSHRKPGRDVQKVAIKQSHDIRAFLSSGSNEAQVGNCRISEHRASGSVQSKGRSIKWDLGFEPDQPAQFNMIPESLPALVTKAGLVPETMLTWGEDLRFSGTTEVDGELITWNNARGMLSHHAGSRSGHSWVWAHCNFFVDEQNQPAPFIFEGISGRGCLLGSLPSPKVSALYFHYQGKSHRFNSLLDLLRIRSKNRLTDWQFAAERGDLSFRGEVRGEHKDFVGLTYEDTNGSLLYCATSKLSDMQVHVYRRGKLEAAFYATGTTSFDVVSRDRNPYVPLMI